MISFSVPSLICYSIIRVVVSGNSSEDCLLAALICVFRLCGVTFTRIMSAIIEFSYSIYSVPVLFTTICVVDMSYTDALLAFIYTYASVLMKYTIEL